MQTQPTFGISKPKNIFSLCVKHEDGDPTSFSKAIKNSTWGQAMMDEFNAFLENDTWNLIPYTPSMNVVGRKWIYKTKYALAGLVDCYKARLIALSYHSRQVLIITKPSLQLSKLPLCIEFSLLLFLATGLFINLM